MQNAFVVIVVALLGASTGSVAQKSDPMATVKAFVDAFNKGDSATAVALCAAETSILDEFPPHEWHGAGGCAQWIGAYDADATKNQITDPVVTLGKPRHVDMSGDVAYIVVPANYAYKKAGKPVKETGSILTISLKNGAGGWKITGWSWAKH